VTPTLEASCPRSRIASQAVMLPKKRGTRLGGSLLSLVPFFKKLCLASMQNVAPDCRDWSSGKVNFADATTSHAPNVHNSGVLVFYREPAEHHTNVRNRQNFKSFSFSRTARNFLRRSWNKKSFLFQDLNLHQIFSVIARFDCTTQNLSQDCPKRRGSSSWHQSCVQRH